MSTETPADRVRIDLTSVPVGEEWVLMNGQAHPLSRLPMGPQSLSWDRMWYRGWASGTSYPVMGARDEGVDWEEFDRGVVQSWL